MRCQRVRMSISVWSSMWPICSEPVTFGGGMTMQKASPGAAGSARKRSPFDQNSAHFPSISCGSYALEISRAILGIAREIAKAYDPQLIEGKWAEFWSKGDLF